MLTKFLKLCLVLTLSLQLSGCSLEIKKHEDPFYNDVGTWDSFRTPLIKPYEMILINKEFGWQLTLKGNMPSQYYYYKFAPISDISKIAVQNNFILAYSTYPENVDESVGQIVLNWFVISPDMHLEMGFADEEEFLKYIQQLGIQQPDWQMPDDVYREFYKTGCLDWIPDCKE